MLYLNAITNFSKDENNSVVSSINKEMSGNESNVNPDGVNAVGSTDPHPEHKVDM